MLQTLYERGSLKQLIRDGKCLVDLQVGWRSSVKSLQGIGGRWGEV